MWEYDKSYDKSMEKIALWSIIVSYSSLLNCPINNLIVLVHSQCSKGVILGKSRSAFRKKNSKTPLFTTKHQTADKAENQLMNIVRHLAANESDVGGDQTGPKKKKSKHWFYTAGKKC